MSKGFGVPTSSPPSATIKKLKRSVIKEFEALEDQRSETGAKAFTGGYRDHCHLGGSLWGR